MTWGAGVGASVAFKISADGVEPPDYSARPDLHAEFWRAVVAIGLEVKDRELAEGRDAQGNPLKPISTYTREHRKSAMGPADPNAPPLTPAYGLSRTRSLLTGRAHARERYALFYWRADPVTGRHWGQILGYHRAGKGRLPRRDVIGLSAEGTAEVKRRVAAWWAQRVRHNVPVPTPVKTPTPAGAVLIKSRRYNPKNPAAAVPTRNRRIGQLEINGDVYTLAGGSEAQVRRMVANGSFSGFARGAHDEHGGLTAQGERGKRFLAAARGGGASPPPESGKRGPRPGPKPKRTPPPPPKPQTPLDLARGRQRAENAAAAQGATPAYRDALRQFPDLIPPGPIQDRIAKYHVGDAKIAEMLELLTPMAEKGRELALDLVRADAALYTASSESRGLEKLKDRRGANWTAQDEAGLTAARAAEARAAAVARDARQRRANFAARRAAAVARVLKAGCPVAYGGADVPEGHRNNNGQPLKPLTGDVRRNAAFARRWLRKITEAGDSDKLDTRWGTPGPDARAHFDPARDHIQLSDDSPVNDAVHELGHFFEEKLHTAGEPGFRRSLEFLKYRVADETPVDMHVKFGVGEPGEMGRKDKFDSVWSERRAYYVGKHYADGSEIVSMGLEELYNDPLNLVKNDPEYAKYLLGMLDGSLR